MTDLHWLAATVLMTALFWIPYVLGRIGQMGIMGAMANPSKTNPALAQWAQRAKAAHSNAVENLVLFAPLVLIAHMLGLSGPTTAMLAMLYFFARLAHFLVYTIGIPVFRTLTFAGGWTATVGVGAVVFGLIG